MADDDKTQPPAPRTGQQTGMLKSKELDLKQHELDLKAEAAADARRLAALNRERDDRFAFWKLVLTWSAGVLGLLLSVVIIGLCLWFEQTMWLTAFVGTCLLFGAVAVAARYGRSINLSAFGITASTTTTTTDTTTTNATTTTTTSDAAAGVPPVNDKPFDD